MKKILLLLLPLFVLISFSSCDKGDEWKDKEDWGDKEEWEDKEDWGDKDDCFKLVYPVSYTMPDGSTISGDEEEALWAAMKDWYEENEETEEKPALVYPVTVSYEDEETVVVENEEEMIVLKEDCKEEWGDEEDCFSLVYPVSYTLPDGSTISGDDEEALWAAMKDWYEANEETEEEPTLVYPVTVSYEDEETVVVENEEEMIVLKEDCKEEWELCEWDEAAEASGEAFEKHIVEELVYSEDCGCYTSGFEKFLENGQTRFLIYYKLDDCVGYAYKITCENGDCKSEDTQKCKFFQNCD